MSAMLAGMAVGIVVLAVLMGVLVGLNWRLLRMLYSLSSQLRETMLLVQQVSEVVVTTPAKLASLSAELDATIRSQRAALQDVLGVVEKTADQALFTARRVAGDLAVRQESVDTALAKREDRVDTASGEVAEDLAASRRRADATVGEPGAAADAALRPDDEAS